MNTANDRTYTPQPHTALIDRIHPSLRDSFVAFPDDLTQLTSDDLAQHFGGSDRYRRVLKQMVQRAQQAGGKRDDAA